MPRRTGYRAFLPPIDTPGLNAREREILRVAHTLQRDDAAAALNIKVGTLDVALTSIRTKCRDLARREMVKAEGAPSPDVGGGYLTRGWR